MYVAVDEPTGMVTDSLGAAVLQVVTKSSLLASAVANA